MNSPTRARSRIGGVDIARVIAIAGMVMVHFGPSFIPDTPAGVVYDFSHGRASILFALLAGVGVSLLYQRRTGGSAMAARGRILLRATLLLPIGLWLQSLDHGVLVILQYYALYFMFAALIMTLADRWLLAGAVAVIALGPVIYLAGESNWPEWHAAEPTTIGDPVGKILRDLFLAGAYPLVTWAAPILVGIWVGRRQLGDTLVQVLLIGAGAVIAIAAAAMTRLSGFVDSARLNELLSNDPHSEMPLWIAGSIGSALAALGLALLAGNLLGRAVWPLVAAGQLALTIYVGHLILLHIAPDVVRREFVSEAFVSVGLFMLITIALSTLWRMALPRGPLEALLGLPWWLIERAIPERGRSRA